ncbi:MAG: hypothetical protein ACLPX9_01550 [Rhodomicrobium sp.]
MIASRPSERRRGGRIADELPESASQNLILDSCLSKGRRPVIFEWCKTQADRAKTSAHIKRCPDFAAYDRAELKKSRNFIL